MKYLLSFLFVLCVAAVTQAVAADKLNHVVAFKFKGTTTSAQVQEVEKAFCALKKKISQIKTFEWGTNVSPEKLDKGFTHGFVLSFKSEKDRDTYLVHPDHKAFASLVGPLVEDVFVIDFLVRK